MLRVCTGFPSSSGQAYRSDQYKISEIISVDDLLCGIDDAKKTRLSLYQPLQFALLVRTDLLYGVLPYNFYG